MDVQKLIEKFDTEGLNPAEIIEVKHLYKQFTQPNAQDTNFKFQESIYFSIDTCANCLRTAINQIRYATTKKGIV